MVESSRPLNGMATGGEKLPNRHLLLFSKFMAYPLHSGENRNPVWLSRFPSVLLGAGVRREDEVFMRTCREIWIA